MRQFLHALIVEDNSPDLVECALVVACLIMSGVATNRVHASAIASSLTITGTTLGTLHWGTRSPYLAGLPSAAARLGASWFSRSHRGKIRELPFASTSNGLPQNKFNKIHFLFF